MQEMQEVYRDLFCASHTYKRHPMHHILNEQLVQLSRREFERLQLISSITAPQSQSSSSHPLHPQTFVPKQVSIMYQNFQ